MDKSKIVSEFRQREGDTGSSEVQVALLTERIRYLTEHLGVHTKDFHSRRGLLALANRRRRLLAYLKRTNVDSYKSLVQRLNLRK
ncbi:MAG: 30S ribosomal protein S15 [Puniceicoccales bacterium]|jgi:small subunit ribosomal protein S15|nr:30S ribosomal protein S15 [Puniceicoccales bacterium]